MAGKRHGHVRLVHEAQRGRRFAVRLPPSPQPGHPRCVGRHRALDHRLAELRHRCAQLVEQAVLGAATVFASGAEVGQLDEERGPRRRAERRRQAEVLRHHPQAVGQDELDGVQVAAAPAAPAGLATASPTLREAQEGHRSGRRAGAPDAGAPP